VIAIVYKNTTAYCYNCETETLWATGRFFLTIAAKERRKPSSVLALQLLYKILDSGLRRNDEDELHPPSVPPIESGKKETSVIRQGVTKGISSPFFCAISLPQRIQQQG